MVLKEKHIGKLSLLVIYYLVLYFEINNSLVYDPQHVQSSTELIRLQPKEVQDVVKKHIS